MDVSALLQHIGLDQKEASVYRAALELGEATMTELARAAGLKRSTTYIDVEGLLVQGLLSETTKGKRKIYAPVHPRRLAEMVKARERQVEEALPELVALYNTPKAKPKIQVFEGEQGTRFVYTEVYAALNRKEEALWLARISAIAEHFPFAIAEFKRMIRLLKNPRIRELNFDEPAARKWAKESKHLRGTHHHQRLLRSEDEFGFTDVLIFGTKVVLFSFSRETCVVVIDSKEISQTLRAVFNALWKVGVAV